MRRDTRLTLTDVLAMTATIMLIVLCCAAETRDALKTNPFGPRLTGSSDANAHHPTRRKRCAAP